MYQARAEMSWRRMGMLRDFVIAKPRNPIAANGEADRNFKCPYYTDCLDHAILKKWMGWRCDQCEHRDLAGPQQEV